MRRSWEFDAIVDGEFTPVEQVSAVGLAELPFASKIQVKQIEGRSAAIGQVHAISISQVNAVYERTERAVEGLATRLSRSGSAAAQLGPEVEQAHQTAQRNAALRLYQMVEEAAATIQEQAKTASDWITSLPSSVFYSPTCRERLQAALEGTHVELLQRPGMKPLSLWEDAKNLATGGDVVAQRAWEYDRAEMAGRLQQRSRRGEAAALRDELEIALERLATLEALMAGTSSALEGQDRVVAGEAVEDDGRSNELLELIRARDTRLRERVAAREG